MLLAQLINSDFVRTNVTEIHNVHAHQRVCVGVPQGEGRISQGQVGVKQKQGGICFASAQNFM